MYLRDTEARPRSCAPLHQANVGSGLRPGTSDCEPVRFFGIAALACVRPSVQRSGSRVVLDYPFCVDSDDRADGIRHQVAAHSIDGRGRNGNVGIARGQVQFAPCAQRILERSGRFYGVGEDPRKEGQSQLRV